jgi:hypothetical protein
LLAAAARLVVSAFFFLRLRDDGRHSDGFAAFAYRYEGQIRR